MRLPLQVTLRHTLLAGVLLSAIFATVAKDRLAAAQMEFPRTYAPSGDVTYKQFCAACHGSDAKGKGPAASTLKKRPANLTTLARRHEGEFPYEYVAEVLRFGPGFPAHGSSEMPTWGPMFRVIDKNNEQVVQQRIRNLCDYLASLQEGFRL